MPLIPTINLSGIGSAIGAVIQNQYDLEQRQQQTQIDKAKIDLMSYETNFMNELKMNHGDDPVSWADKYREAITKKASELTTNFKYETAKSSFETSMLSVMEQRVPGILQAADQKEQQNAVDALQLALSQSTNYADAATSISTFSSNPSLVRWAGSKAALDNKMADAFVAKAKEIYTQELQTNPIEAEKNFRENLLHKMTNESGDLLPRSSDQDKATYSKLLSELNPIRAKAADGISAENKYQFMVGFNTALSNIYKTPHTRSEQIALLNAEADKAIQALSSDDSKFDFKAMNGMIVDDRVKALNEVNNFKSAWASGNTPETQYSNGIATVTIAIADYLEKHPEIKDPAQRDAVAARVGKAAAEQYGLEHPDVAARVLAFSADKTNGWGFAAVDYQKMKTQVDSEVKSALSGISGAINGIANLRDRSVQQARFDSARGAVDTVVNDMLNDFFKQNPGATAEDASKEIKPRLYNLLGSFGIQSPDTKAIADVMDLWRSGTPLNNSTSTPGEALDLAGVSYISSGGSALNIGGKGKQSDVKEVKTMDLLMQAYILGQAKSAAPNGVPFTGSSFNWITDKDNRRWVKFDYNERKNGYEHYAGSVFIRASDDGKTLVPFLGTSLSDLKKTEFGDKSWQYSDRGGDLGLVSTPVR